MKTEIQIEEQAIKINIADPFVFSSNLHAVIYEHAVDDVICNLMITQGVTLGNNFFDFALQNKGWLSYIPKNKMDKFPDFLPVDDPYCIHEEYNYHSSFYNYSIWNNPLRAKHAVMQSAGKVARKLFPWVADRHIEKFNLLIIQHSVSTDDIKEVCGEDIRDYYHYNRYYNEGGSLGNSCMRYNSSQNYFDIYTKNKNVSMLIMFVRENGVLKDKICGRAILWKDIFFKELDRKACFMDRIYTNDSRDEAIFIQYAIEKGYVYKQSQSFDTKTYFRFGTGSNKIDWNEKITIRNLELEFDHYPYTDTFSFMDWGLSMLSNFNKHNQYELDCTGGDLGGILERRVKWSEYHQRDVQEEYAVWSDHHNSFLDASRSDTQEVCWTSKDAIRHSDYFNVNDDDTPIVTVGGRSYHKDDIRIVYSEYLKKYIRVDISTNSTVHGVVREIDLVRTPYDDGNWLLEDCITLADGCLHPCPGNLL